MWDYLPSVLGPMVYKCRICGREALLPGDEMPKKRSKVKA